MGGASNIPWSAIDLYAERFGFTRSVEEYDRFVRLVEDLDRTFLTYLEASSKK